jgi:hypothetical protein
MVAGAVAMAAWLTFGWWDRARRDPGPDAAETEFLVDGLDCPVWCSVRLLDAIDGLDGARVTAIDQEHGRVVVRHDPGRQTASHLRELLARHGFPMTGVTAGHTAPEK